MSYDLLSLIVPTLVTLGTAYFSYRITSSKNTSDVQSEFRDDLMSQIERQNQRLNAQDDRIEKQQALIIELQSDNRLISFEKHQLEVQVQRLQSELDLFNKKVYYIPTKETK